MDSANLFCFLPRGAAVRGPCGRGPDWTASELIPRLSPSPSRSCRMDGAAVLRPSSGAVGVLPPSRTLTRVTAAVCDTQQKRRSLDLDHKISERATR